MTRPQGHCFSDTNISSCKPVQILATRVEYAAGRQKAWPATASGQMKARTQEDEWWILVEIVANVPDSNNNLLANLPPPCTTIGCENRLQCHACLKAARDFA